MVTAAGEEIDRIFDVPEADAFVASLRGYLHGSGTIPELERRLAEKPDDLQIRFDLGTRLAIRGERERAVMLLADIVIADRSNARGLASAALLTMGKWLFLRGQNDPDTARKLLKALLSAFPRCKEAEDARTQLAIAYSRLGDDARALGIFRDRIAAGRNKGYAYNAFAWFYFREKKDLARAIEVTREGLAAAPRDDNLWDSQAEFLHLAGKRAEALGAAEKALALKPSDPYYQYQVRRFARAR